MNLVPGASPIFTVDRGYQGDGSAAYLSIADAATAATLLTDSSASLGVWLNICPVEDRVVIGQNSGGGTRLSPKSAVDTINGRMQHVAAGPAISTVAGYSGLGMTRMTRQSVSQYYLRPHGQARILRTMGSNGNAQRPQRLLSGYATVPGSALNYSAARIAVAYFGGALTDAQEVAMDAALQTYLNAVGGA